MSGRFAFKFKPEDWRGDIQLRLCSLAARGVWFELLAAMLESPKFGYLVKADGQPWSIEETARFVGSQNDEVAGALAELKQFGIFSETRSGVIWSPLMLERKSELLFPERRPAIPAAIKDAVIARDGERCVYCGDQDGPFEFDHLLPWSRGGKHSIDNLCRACWLCNWLKGDRTPEEWGGAKR